MSRLRKNRLVGERIRQDETFGLPLFTQTGEVERNESFAALNEKQLTESRRAVFDVWKKHGTMSDRQAHVKSGLAINIITARRNDLVELGLIVKDGTAFDNATERNVSMWRVKC